MTDEEELDELGATLALLDYRRRVSDLYRRVREMGPGPDSWAVWREERDVLFREHPQSALEPEDRDGFAGLKYFPYDPDWSFEVSVEPVDDREETIGHSGQGSTPFRRFGRLELPFGETLELFWLESYGGGVFLPFRDGTSGAETYGGGRYLLDSVKGSDLGGEERLVLDFNFAYHPSCVYSNRWSCPLAPAQNHLSTQISAGERLP